MTSVISEAADLAYRSFSRLLDPQHEHPSSSELEVTNEIQDLIDHESLARTEKKSETTLVHEDSDDLLSTVRESIIGANEGL